jgi:hypothetical protein
MSTETDLLQIRLRSGLDYDNWLDFILKTAYLHGVNNHTPSGGLGFCRQGR